MYENNLSIEKIKELNPKGIIFTGGPASVYGAGSPLCEKEIFDLIDSTEGSHFIITSHSPTLTNLFEPQKVMMLDCNDKKASVFYGDITKAIHTLTDGQWGYIDHTIFLDKSRPLLLQ